MTGVSFKKLGEPESLWWVLRHLIRTVVSKRPW